MKLEEYLKWRVEKEANGRIWRREKAL